MAGFGVADDACYCADEKNSKKNELFSLFFTFFVQSTPSEGYYYT